MKILHICQRDDPGIGGSLRVAEELMYEQQRQRIDGWLLFLYGKPAYVTKAFSPQAVCLGLESSRQAMRGVILLWWAIRKIKPDIIHLHDGLIWPRLVLILIRIPVVMHAHLPSSPSIRRLSCWLIRSTSDRIIGISLDTIESWAKVGYPRTHIHYVTNGVNFERFRPVGIHEKTEIRKQLKLPLNGKLVLWVGRLHRSTKGTDRLERMVGCMPDGMTLVVVGFGPEYEGIRGRCRSHIKARRLIVVGSTNFPEFYYRACDVFLFTSHSEAFGLVILEAVASGLPIVAFPVTNGGGAVELLHEVNSFLIKDGASCEEVEAVLTVALSRSSDVKEMRDWIKNKYSWGIKTRETEVVYRCLLGEEEETGTPKVLVCQHGARHRYAIPRMLEQEGILAALYTDSSAESFLGRFATAMGRLVPFRLRALTKRQVIGVPRNKIHSFDYPLIRTMLGSGLGRGKSALRADKEYGDFLSARLIPRGTQRASIIYSMNRSNLDFVQYAKSRGCKSVIDIFIRPLTEQVVHDESLCFPDWGLNGMDAKYEFGMKLWKETVAIGDILLCPSEWVAEGVRQVAPDVEHKIRIVPYGCSIEYDGRSNTPVKGRVLFAGGDALRKGLHYLAKAATQLKNDIPELDVRIAGSLPPEVVDHPIAKDLNFLGKLNLEQMKEEYLTADLFVLPSLSEGFAGVVAEAISAGCPVVVTKEAGSPVIDGREGLLVPSRDIEALSCAMKRLISDRVFRTRCSESCVEQSPFYSEKQWGKRLLCAINSME